MRISGSGLFAVAALCATLAACTTGGAGPTQLSPGDLSALEAQRAQHPTDPDLNLRLAKAYYAANRFGDAACGPTGTRNSSTEPNSNQGFFLGLRKSVRSISSGGTQFGSLA